MNIDRQMIVDAIKGCSPSYKMMNHPLCKRNGDYSGSHDRWDWNYSAFEKAEESDEELYNFYKMLKEIR